ncbi:hypothetical protein [Polyangium jinanense]|uniref:Uncharacterized protein n=1 Tax=Polyangium jinanense TaxID=2829994 RepID=A0A9X3XBJ3_9BACT|nr:hypothetical protein [Polyangium jinanense]MDC3960027.1 hypothetical protein [Polyangium jinanense]MDC3986245.1 hypothetical protein [Polyangium jinanense]
MVLHPRLGPLHDVRPRLVAFGNVAVGFIAIGNVAVGFIAIGASVAVGPIAIGINAVGILLGLGMNAVGTAAIALINGLGLFTFAGVNGLGARAFAYVNVGQSVFVALLWAGVQLVAAHLVKRRMPAAAEEAPPQTVPLGELTSGARDEGLVRARVVSTTETSVLVEEDTPEENVAQLVLSGPARASLEAAQRASGSPALLVTVRASRETQPQAAQANYRSAPEVRRVLWGEHFEAIPAPPPIWARPGVVQRLSRTSMFAAAAIAIVEFVRSWL